MCFSATGSFVAAALNAAAGVAIVRKSVGMPESVLASYPLVFAAQQAMEGVLWLVLPGHADQGAAMGFANVFVFVALAIWPVLVPMTAYMLEPVQERRSTLAWLMAVGVAYAIYAVVAIVQHPYAAQVLGHTLSYDNGQPFALLARAVYGVCTCAPLLLSSARTLKLLGVCVFAGLLISLAFYYFTLLSVWCFFSAVASGVIFIRTYVELPHLRRQAATAS